MCICGCVLRGVRSVQSENLADGDTQAFLNTTGRFFEVADAAQLQMNVPLVVSLGKAYAAAATARTHPRKGASSSSSSSSSSSPRASFKVLSAVAPLRAAARKVFEGREKVRRSLTSMDTDALQLCVLGGAYPMAVRHVVDLDVMLVDPRHSFLAAEDYLRWWYYAGLAHCGVKQWGAAADCFLTCVTTPATVLSAVVVAAYKKLSLVSLLAHGRKVSLPPHTATVVSRGLKSSGMSNSSGSSVNDEPAMVAAAKPTGPGGGGGSPYSTEAYEAIATKFEANDTDGLLAECEKSKVALAKDASWGLAMQVTKALTQRRIARLATCFLTLSLADVAAQAGLKNGAPEAEAELLAMIRAGTLVASIDQRSGMVTFPDDSDGGSSSRTSRSNRDAAAAADARATATKLETMTRACVALGARVEALDVEMSQSPAFLKRDTGAARGGGGGGSAAFMGSDFDPDDLELAEQASLQYNDF